MISLILTTFLACGDSAPEKKVEAPKKEVSKPTAKPEPKEDAPEKEPPNWNQSAQDDRC